MRDKRRILVATGVYPPESGGPATHTKLMEEYMPEYGFEVEALPFSRVRHLPKILRHISYFFQLVHRAFRANVIFAQDTVSVGFPALLAARFARRPLIVRVPGDHAWEQGRNRFGVTDSLDEFQNKKYGWRVELLRKISRMVARRADEIIAPSKYMAEIVNGWLSEGRSAHAIYNGVELPVPTKAPADKPSGTLIVSIGRLVPWKGFARLIEAVSGEMDWHLVIVGDGPEEKNLKQKVQEVGCAGRVTFTGHLPREEALGWASVADAFVLNTSFESFSYQVVEALSLGVPVVCTNIGSLPEIVRDGIDGMLIIPDDKGAIIRATKSIEEDRQAWKKRTESAKLRAEKFSIDKTVRQLSNLIENLI